MKLIKDYSILNLHPTLIEILEDVDYIAGDGTITSAHRPGDDGVHGQTPVRGADRRCRNAAIGNAIKQYVNGTWVYDPDRPDLKCCIFHKCDTYGWHLHFQTHHNTKRQGE
jgi:hypothetical protein